jgi:hypothetical protein
VILDWSPLQGCACEEGGGGGGHAGKLASGGWAGTVVLTVRSILAQVAPASSKSHSVSTDWHAGPTVMTAAQQDACRRNKEGCTPLHLPEELNCSKVGGERNAGMSLGAPFVLLKVSRLLSCST